MSIGYQATDRHIVDYELYELPGVPAMFRGPPVHGEGYVACIGAAQTFGRFASKPFPQLMSQALGVETLNLGRGGAGPAFFLGNPALTKFINAASIVVVQVLSGRSQSNTLFRSGSPARLGVNLHDGREMSADEFYTWLMDQDPALAQRIIDETRTSYTAAMSDLLDAIGPPTILFWFSVRSPDFTETLELPLGRLWGAFPQFVNRATVAHLRAHSDVYVECISSRGLPQPLFDRDGNPTSFQAPGSSSGVGKTHNTYYPSPQMHEEAATLLVDACRKIIDGGE
jgi:hypothetical protein